MAKRIKFSLTMENDKQVRDIVGLRDNFDLKSVISYFVDGKLLTWLEDRYYDTEAEAVKELDKNDPDLGQKLCEIFGVTAVKAQAIDIDVVEQRNIKLAELKQYTSDPALFDRIDDIAASQDEFEQLLGKKLPTIYLMNNVFIVSPGLEDVTLVGIGDVTIQTKDESKIDLKDKNVSVKNLKFDKDLLNVTVLGEMQELERRADEEYSNGEYKSAIELYLKAESLGSGHACNRLGECYYYGNGVKKTLKTAFEYFQKGSQLSDGEASVYVGDFYRLGKHVEKDGNEALRFYNKAIEDDCSRGYTSIGDLYLNGAGNIKKNMVLAIEYLNKGVEHGDAGLANYILGTIYETGGKEIEMDIDKAISYYLESGKQGFPKAYYSIGKIYETGNGVKRSVKTAVEYYKKSGARKNIFGRYVWEEIPEKKNFPGAVIKASAQAVLLGKHKI